MAVQSTHMVVIQNPEEVQRIIIPDQQIIKETEEELIQLSLTAEPRSEAFTR